MRDKDDRLVGRLEPCHLVNPEVWQHFCKMTGRPIHAVDHWTERDVMLALNARKCPSCDGHHHDPE